MHTGRRKRYIIAACIGIVAITVALYSAAQSNPYRNFREWKFDSDKEGKLPDDFLPVDGKSEDAWVIKSHEPTVSGSNLLSKMSSNLTDSDYSVIIVSDRGYSNFKASVKFKIISGEKEQAAGLVFRFQDRNHYFVLVADSANDRFSLCRAEVDKMICTQDVNVKITKDEWHTISAHVAQQGIAGYLDDKLLVQRYDKHYSVGTIGLWTKGDSEVYFDDLAIHY
jgi:hypothetical protein